MKFEFKRTREMKLQSMFTKKMAKNIIQWTKNNVSNKQKRKRRLTKKQSFTLFYLLNSLKKISSGFRKNNLAILIASSYDNLL